MAEGEISTVDLVRRELDAAQSDIEAVGNQAAKQHDQLQNAPQMLVEIVRRVDEATVLTQALRKLCANDGVQAHFSMRAVDARNRVQRALEDSSNPETIDLIAAVAGWLDTQYNLENLVSYDQLGNRGLLDVFAHLQDAKGRLEQLQDHGFRSLVDAAAEVRDLSGTVKGRIKDYRDVL